MPSTAQAQPNIALIKYWGKRDAGLNLPASGSLSLTLASLWTRTRVEFDPALASDDLRLNGAEHPVALERVTASLDLLRARAETGCRAWVETVNNFPTSAGLASSASAFAALVVAANAALGLDLDVETLSILARRGSGSAARSLFGGFVTMNAGDREDGLDARAELLLAPEKWPLTVAVAVTSREAKSVSSSVGMELSRRTSPFYADWLAGAEEDLATARAAVLARDLAALGEISEHNCLKMHAVMLATRPALVYWNSATVACLHRVRALREAEGLNVFFTIDAGPQLKAVCLPCDADEVAAALREIPGVAAVLTSPLGEGARILPGSPSLG